MQQVLIVAFGFSTSTRPSAVSPRSCTGLDSRVSPARRCSEDVPPPNINLLPSISGSRTALEYPPRCSSTQTWIPTPQSALTRSLEFGVWVRIFLQPGVVILHCYQERSTTHKKSNPTWSHYQAL